MGNVVLARCAIVCNATGCDVCGGGCLRRWPMSRAKGEWLRGGRRVFQREPETGRRSSGRASRLRTKEAREEVEARVASPGGRGSTTVAIFI